MFPTASPRLRPDTKTYASCPGPIDPAEKEKFSAHGLNIRPGVGTIHTVYVVHHGLRESVEIFQIDTKPSPPTFAWIGCVVAPETVSMNSISPVPDGGFVVTNIIRRNMDKRGIRSKNPTVADAQAKMERARKRGTISPSQIDASPQEESDS